MTAPALAPAQPYPTQLDELLGRAAAVLQMHQGRMSSVPFVLWSAGDEIECLASTCWQPGEPAARVQVHYLRSGDFVCQSVLGDWFAVDSARWNLDGLVAHDEIERTLWEQEQARRPGARPQGQ